MRLDYLEILNKLQANTPISKEEWDTLLVWLLSEEGKHSVEQDVVREWSAFETLETYDYQRLLNRINQKIDRQPIGKIKFFQRYMRYALEIAAVVVLAIGVAFFVHRQVEQRYRRYVEVHQAEKIEIYNPRGLRTTVTLPDGSMVTLNADSKIAYLKDFLPGERGVQLTGEAFFDVAKDASHPFVVHANGAKLTVLGTSFNVRSYPENEYVETTLVEGLLRVGNGEREYMLTPGDQSRIHRTSQANSVERVNTGDATGWMEGKLYFQQTSFSEIVAMLERTFSVNIKVESNRLQEKKFTGKFEHGESIKQILEILTLSVTGSASVYDKQTNTIIIR